MDWIEELYQKWKIKMKNFSLKKAMVVYLLCAIILAVLAAVITINFCHDWKNLIQRVNGIGEDYRYTGDGCFVSYKASAMGYEEVAGIVRLGKTDAFFFYILSLVQMLCIPIYSVVTVFLVSFFYYKNRLKEPLLLLTLETEAVKRNDLSFSCFYGSADEMGEICGAMDIMRKAVVDNQRNMWELMEEQRKINAAFAHDLRTPLTVISGYVDMLMEYYPAGQISEKKLIEGLSSIKEQAARLKNFSETMKKVDSFEVLEVKKKKYKTKDLKKKIMDFARGMEGEDTPEITVSMQSDGEEIYCDENIILEVLGNLLSNALRYGKENVEILAVKEEDRLFLYVKDDGRGMTKEELYKADSPYYSDKTYEEAGQDMHFGLGLTICKILCKKHGGSLGFSNSVEHGAIVCAEFFVG